MSLAGAEEGLEDHAQRVHSPAPGRPSSVAADRADLLAVLQQQLLHLLSAVVILHLHAPELVHENDVGREPFLLRHGEDLALIASLEALLLGPAHGPLAAARTASITLDRSPSSVDRNPLLLRGVDEGLTLEQLSAALSCNPNQLAHELLQLELAGVVEPKPGLRWRSV